MFQIILTLISALVKAVFLFLLGYLLYYRVFDYVIRKRHYGRQQITWSIKGIFGNWPMIGNIPEAVRVALDMKKRNSKNNYIDEMINMYADGYKPVIML